MTSFCTAEKRTLHRRKPLKLCTTLHWTLMIELVSTQTGKPTGIGIKREPKQSTCKRLEVKWQLGLRAQIPRAGATLPAWNQRWWFPFDIVSPIPKTTWFFRCPWHPKSPRAEHAAEERPEQRPSQTSNWAGGCTARGANPHGRAVNRSRYGRIMVAFKLFNKKF